MSKIFFGLQAAVSSALLAFVPMLTPLSAEQTYIWSGSSNNLWGNSANWVGSPALIFNNQTDIVFDTDSVVNRGNAVSIHGDRTLRSLAINTDYETGNNNTFDIRTYSTFSSGTANLTFSAASGNASITLAQSTSGTVRVRLGSSDGGSVILNSNLDLAQHNTFFNVNGFQFDGALSGSGAISKTGAGEVRLARNNSGWSGGMNIHEGNVTIFSDPNAMGTGIWTLGGGANNTRLSVGSTLNYNNAGGLVVAAGTGTRTIQNHASAAGNPALTGGIDLSAGKEVTFAITQHTAGTHDRITLSGAVTGTGGIVKTGTGTLILSAANTYTGKSMINEGTLKLDAAGSMRFLIGQAGVSTVVAGGGDFVADGTFDLDLSAADTTPGAYWQLVTTASSSLGDSFAVAGFTEFPAGTWSFETHGVTYQFVESARTLFVVNIPPYDRWAQLHGLDPDDDSLSNRRKYAFGSNPAAAEREPWRTFRDGKNTVFSWLQRKDGSADYTLLENADLMHGPWVESAVPVEPDSGSDSPHGYQWMRISVLPALDKNFYRVQATMPQRQTITFDALPTKTFGLPSFTLTGFASSGLPISYTSSNPEVAIVSGSTVTIVGVGITTLIVSQAGDDAYGFAADVLRTLSVMPPSSLTVDAKADFGAVGDGIADDTDALQDALDYLSARIVSDGGACLVLPPGTYKITRRLNFEKATARSGQCQGVTIRGAESRGPDATVIYSAGTEGALFFNVNDDNGHYYQFGVRIQDLQIQAGTANAGAAIEIRRMSAADAIQSVVPLIKNVVITTDTDANYFRYGIVGRKVVWPHFTDVSVTGVRNGMEACIFLERVYSFTVNNCHLAGAKTGIDARLGGEQNDIMHSTITDVDTGINMHADPYAPTGPSSLGGAIYGCDISAWDAGVMIDHKGFFVINDNAFNSLGNASGYRHLSLKKVHRTIVSDNTFTGAPDQTGVYLENPYCRGNTIACNDFGSLAAAVHIGAGVSQTLILDNLPDNAPVDDAGSGTFVRRNAPRAFRAAAARYPAYGCEPGRVLVPWNRMAHGPVVKVTDYGANGLDTLDDTAAILRAVEAVQARLDSGGQATLYFPAGIYHLSSRLDLTQGGADWQNLTIAGDGAHVSAIAVTGTQGVFKIDCTQPVPIHIHGLRIDPRTANPSTAIEITQQNGTVNGNRSLLLQDVHFFTWDTAGRYFRGGIMGTGIVRPLLQNVEMRSVSTDSSGEFGIRFTGGYGLDWQGGRIYGKQAGGIIDSLGGQVNIRGPWFGVGGLSGLTLDANGGSFSWNAAHTDAPVNLRISNANDAAVINTLTLSGPQNQNPAIGTTLYFENCTDLHVRDNILAAAYQTPRPSNVFVQLGESPGTCNGFDISGNIMVFNDGEGTGIGIPAQNLNGAVYDNRIFGVSINDIVCDEPSTAISLLPRD